MKKKPTCLVSFEDGETQLSAGQLVVTARTPEEKMYALDHFKRGDDDEARAKRLLEVLSTSEPLVLRPKAGGSSQWFRRVVTLDVEWTKPYIDLLRKRTGWPEEAQVVHHIPNVHEYDYWGCLHHTHYIIDQHIEHDHLVSDIVFTSGDWNGKTGEERAEWMGRDTLIGNIAHTEVEPEYIPCGNLFRHNPNYATGRSKRRPAVHNEYLFHAFVDHWLLNHANDTQRLAVTVSHEIMEKNHHGVSDLHNHRGYGDLRFSWHSSEIKWADFQKLTPSKWKKLCDDDAAERERQAKAAEDARAAEAAKKSPTPA